MRAIVAACALVLASCAGLFGPRLQPGVDGPEQVTAKMGRPVDTWQETDGGMTWSYPSGPLGRSSYMVRFDTAGKVRSVEQVLDNSVFARIVPGTTTRDEVWRMLGRPGEEWYLPRQQETVWDYRYLDLGEPWIFRVGFTPAGVVTGYARIPENNAPNIDIN